MITHRIRHRVRYRECDRMGVVYHTHSLDHFEAGRTEFIRALGVPYKDLEDAGILIQVVEVNVRYHRPAFYDDVLVITTMMHEPPTSRLELAYEVRREGEEHVLVSGESLLCFVDRQRGRPVRAPEIVVQAVERKLSEDGS